MKINYLYLSALLVSLIALGAVEARSQSAEEEEAAADEDFGASEHLKGGNSIGSGKAESKAVSVAAAGGSAASGLETHARESGLGNLFLGSKAAPLEVSKLEAAKVGTIVAPSASVREVAKAEGRHELFSLKTLTDYAHLLLNPFELVKAIAVHFKLDLAKFTEKVGRGLIFGVEALLSPVVIVVRIVEKVFVPDHCRLKFMCRVGAYLSVMRQSVSTLSPHFLEQSLFIKSFSEGIIGKDCEAAFPSCQLHLKEQYEKLRVTESVQVASAGARAASDVRGISGVSEGHQSTVRSQ